MLRKGQIWKTELEITVSTTQLFEEGMSKVNPSFLSIFDWIFLK